MKKIIKILLIYMLFIASVSANDISFYWEKNPSWDLTQSRNITEINKNLEKFYKKTGLNTDFVILWKWDSCYQKTNFDSCIQKRENYSSDLIVILSMKSDIKSRWDIRSLIKDEFKESITPRELKNIQDSITYNFKNKNFSKWLKEYLDNLDNLIDRKCYEVWVNSCDAVKLAKQYHNYVANKEYEKKYNAMMKFIYYIVTIVWIILWYLWLKKFYVRNINNLYKDLKYTISSLEDYELFKKDKNHILTSLRSFSKTLKKELWNLDKNAFKLKGIYWRNREKYDKIINELESMQKNYLEREKLKNRLDDAINIDL